MTISKREWQDEQNRVEYVIEKIRKKVDVLQQQTSGKKSDLIEIRKNFWEDVTVNLEDAVEAAETAASLKQQAEVLSERERSYQHAYRQLDTLNRLQKSPYFGRIDFVEEGEETADQIYLGIASFFDQEKEEFLIYDWRAPISSLYYDYPPGPAKYQTPSGWIEGKIDLKRQYVIRNGQLEGMFDTGVTIGDELLQNVLGKQADIQMKSIVATIQKEQNRIIRNERSKLLIVWGAAGSGKTSVALQRVAYLLYRYRESLRAENILLFSPNYLFKRYVATVLPELGEENMQQKTFPEFLEHQLSKMFSLEDPFTQMEYVLASEDSRSYQERIAGIRYKATIHFMEVIERYLDFLLDRGMIFKEIRFRDRVLISADQMKEQFYALDSISSLPNRIKWLKGWLHQQLDEQMGMELEQDWVEDEIELLDEEVYSRMDRKLRRQKQLTQNTFNDFERQKEMLARWVVEQNFKPLRKQVNQLDFLDIPAVYQQLFVNPDFILNFTSVDQLPDQWEGICKQTLEKWERSELGYEDATPFLYLKERIIGFQTDSSIRHVFIDEAQDYSPFQFAYIQKRFPRSRMTVLGDLNQAIYAHANEGNIVPLLKRLFQPEETEEIFLHRSYRSTKQITEFAKGMIMGGNKIEAFQREGKKPRITPVADYSDLASKLIACLHRFQEEGYQTIAIICKTAKESLAAYQLLSEQIPLTLISKDTASYGTGILVIPSYLAKGVEFDAVIIFNASQKQYGRESERKLFYTACTRAMHQLEIFFMGERSKFLNDAFPDSYILAEKD
jgi:DNA helicase-2/ATP-dependent DNA helicase PcrA